MRDERQVQTLKEAITGRSRRIKGTILATIGAAFLAMKGDAFNLDDYARRVNRIELNFPQGTLLTMVGSTTTAWADGDWVLTNEKDRYRLLLNVGVIVGDTTEGTALADGALQQLTMLGRIDTKRTTGRTSREAFRRYSLGVDRGEQDGVTTLVAQAKHSDPLAQQLMPGGLEEAVAKAIDAQNPDEATTFSFNGLNGVTIADSVDGVQGIMLPCVLDAVVGG